MEANMKTKTSILVAAVLGATALLALHRGAWAEEGTMAAGPPEMGHEVAIFAGGCFWCMEGPFEKLDGVVSVLSGYTGGFKKNPTYEEVGSGKTGHAESIRVEFDPKKITYEQLLKVYWHNIDPTTGDGQFCDHGFQYRPEIFYTGEAQLKAAEKSKKEIEESGVVDTVAVRISPASAFYIAEDYHQDFYKKNPEHYHRYREGCGRDRRLAEIWGKSDH